MKNIVLFVGVAGGTGLLIAGGVAFSRGDRAGWTYLIGAALLYTLAFGPGRRLQRALFGDGK